MTSLNLLFFLSAKEINFVAFLLQTYVLWVIQIVSISTPC